MQGKIFVDCKNLLRGIFLHEKFPNYSVPVYNLQVLLQCLFLFVICQLALFLTDYSFGSDIRFLTVITTTSPLVVGHTHDPGFGL